MASYAKFDNRQFSDGTPVNMVKQVVQVRGDGVARTNSSISTLVSLLSTNITTDANSKLFLWFHAHYNISHSMENPVIKFFIDGVEVGDWDTKHAFYMETSNAYQFRPTIDLPFVSPALSAGSHTVEIKYCVSQGNGTVTFQTYGTSYADRAYRLNIMEISG